MIVGIDEVGRGPWAGPLVFGAVVLGDAQIEGLTDSKKLSTKRREQLNELIHNQAASVGLGWVSAEEIDEVGLSNALSLACRRALEQITVPYQQIIIDGTINFLKDTGKGPYVTTLAKADLLIPSVSAASIVAKVARDSYMAQQDRIFTGYGFASHVGYGTAAHRLAIEQLGVTPLHRKSFAPIATIIGNSKPVSAGNSPKASSKDIGDTAEDAATKYLQNLGYEIIDRNWKTKACEIDIVARKNDTIFFVEVKYRRSKDQGGGVAAITQDKLHRMKRAALMWLQKHGEHDVSLAVIEVTGADYDITLFVDQVQL